MTPKTITLGPHERVVAVTPEHTRGPGWSNLITWVHIVDYRTSKYRCESIQPTERADALHHLWHPAAAMHAALMGVVPTKTEETSQ